MHQPSTNTIDAAIAAAGSKATYAGAGASVSGWLFSSEFSVVAGLLIGLAGLAINYYFKRREDARLQQEHDMRLVEHTEHMAQMRQAVKDRSKVSC